MPNLRIVYLVAVIAALMFALPVSARAEDFTSLYNDAEKARKAGNYQQAEEKLLRALEFSPENVEAMMYLGMVQAFQEKYSLALDTIGQALKLAPENFDLKILDAQVKGWAGRLDEARQDTARILSVNPDNIDANLLSARLAYYAGDMDAAEHSYRRVLELDSASADARQGLSDVASARLAQSQTTPRDGSVPAQWRLDVGYSTSSFSSGNRPDWHEGYLNLSRKYGDNTVGTRIEHARRFGKDDTYLRLDLDRRLTDTTTGYVHVGGTPEADFLARWTLEVGGSWKLWDGLANGWIGPTLATVDLKQKDYSTGDVRNVDPGLEQYLFNDRLWVTFKKINTRDVAAGKTHPGWSGRIDLKAVNDLGVFMGYSETGESEQGVTAETTSHFFGIVGDITPDLAGTLSYTRDDRESIYIRDNYTAGVTIKF